MNESRSKFIKTFPYKEHFIEVEVCEMENGRFHAWPYISGRGILGSMVREHFLLSQEDFTTKDEALLIAVKEGQHEIDSEFVVG